MVRVGLDEGPPVALVTGKLLGLRVGRAAEVAEQRRRQTRHPRELEQSVGFKKL